MIFSENRYTPRYPSAEQAFSESCASLQAQNLRRTACPAKYIPGHVSGI
jgi:hypothetical protein